ncbi:MAG: hypothetical protein JHC74_09480 [Thermoleophilia bacterium]|nr:hypothetical protein [Thermoleophilia bacterium]
MDHPAVQRDETGAERSDRQLQELLQELRVTLPGVQVIFAFLLTVPFTARFDRATGFQRDTYFVTLLSTAVATVLLVAPTALHRLRFGRGQKEDIVQVAHVLMLWGLAALALAMASAVLLVTDVLFGRSTAWLTAGGLLALIVALWLVLPLWRARLRERPPPP